MMPGARRGGYFESCFPFCPRTNSRFPGIGKHPANSTALPGHPANTVVFVSLTLFFCLCFIHGKMTAVQSSDLAAIDYWGGTLTIAFRSGGVYEYFNVPRSEYTGLLQANSHGKYFHAHIKSRYACRRLQ